MNTTDYFDADVQARARHLRQCFVDDDKREANRAQFAGTLSGIAVCVVVIVMAVLSC